MMKGENFRITKDVLLVGLEKNWLTLSEAIKLVNEHSIDLSIDENLLIELNVNEDNKDTIIDLLRTNGNSEKEQAIKYWQHSTLMAIEQSNKPVQEKLKDIEQQWSRFDYPEDWKDFIYYLPNGKSSSEEGVYHLFLDYLSKIT